MFIDATPKLHQLICLRVGSIQLKVVENVAHDWKKLGLLLEINYDVLQTIAKNNAFHMDCCLEVLQKWLNGCACHPITWERLIEALKDADYLRLASDLEKLLSSHSDTTSQHPPSPRKLRLWYTLNTSLSL